MADNIRGGPNPDGLDQFRLAFTKEDCSLMDTDRSGSLNLVELTKAAEDGIFKNTVNGDQKQEAVSGLLDFVKKSPTRKIDSHTEGVPAIEFWNPFDTATNNLSQHDVEIIDKDLDGIMSWQEMKDGAENPSLSKTARLASRVLSIEEQPAHFLDSYRSEPNGDERRLVGPIGISDWHRLNPKFQDLSTRRLREEAEEKTMKAVANPHDKKLAQETTEMYNEILNRDRLIQPSSRDEQVREFLVCNQAQLQKRGMERDSSGRLRLTDAPVKPEDLVIPYGRMIDLLTLRHASSKDNIDFANSMFYQKRYPEAGKLYQDATAAADVIFENPPGGNQSMKDIIRTMQQRGFGEKGLSQFGKELLQVDLEEVMHGPSVSRIENAIYFMAPVTHANKLQFDSSAPHFQPDKAQALLKQAQGDWQSISNLSRSQQPLVEIEKRLKFYQDSNNNGNSDLIEHLKSQKQKRYIDIPANK